MKTLLLKLFAIISISAIVIFAYLFAQQSLFYNIRLPEGFYLQQRFSDFYLYNQKNQLILDKPVGGVVIYDSHMVGWTNLAKRDLFALDFSSGVVRKFTSDRELNSYLLSRDVRLTWMKDCTTPLSFKSGLYKPYW